MKFVSTRGGEKVTAAEAVVKGIAENGGLYVPETFPEISGEEMEKMLEMDYPERCALVLGKFFTEFDKGALLDALREAYSKFEGVDPAPLVRLDDNIYMLELWHGPTCAFKDMALTVLPYLLRKSADMCGIKEQILVLVATSGDTGKAALEGFRDAEGVKIMVFYPSDGVSKMQKMQMNTQEGSNVNVVAVRGNFDDCQSAVKDIFNNEAQVKELHDKNIVLSSANSINFGRLAPQIAYYFSAYCDLVSSEQINYGDLIDFAVPTGNFGNVLAAYYAKLMGLPVRRLHCASNENRVIADFLQSGEYNIDREFYKSTSPSMDILISSNLERLLFEVSGRNAELTAERMQALKTDKRYFITADELKAIQEIFDGGNANEDECVEAMYDVFIDVGYTMDTHTGCAMKVVQDWFEKNKKDETNIVIVSTANPYKFPQDVLYAVTGNDVKDSFKGIKRLHAATAMAVPKCLKELKDKEPRFTKTVDKKKLFSEVLDFVNK